MAKSGVVSFAPDAKTEEKKGSLFEEEFTINEFKNTLKCVIVDKEKNIVVNASKDKQIKVWDLNDHASGSLKNGTPLQLFLSPYGVQSVVLTGERRNFLIAGLQGGHLWPICLDRDPTSTNEEAYVLNNVHSKLVYPMLSLSRLKHNYVLSQGGDNTVKLWRFGEEVEYIQCLIEFPLGEKSENPFTGVLEELQPLSGAETSAGECFFVSSIQSKNSLDVYRILIQKEGTAASISMIKSISVSQAPDAVLELAPGYVVIAIHKML